MAWVLALCWAAAAGATPTPSPTPSPTQSLSRYSSYFTQSSGDCILLVADTQTPQYTPGNRPYPSKLRWCKKLEHNSLGFYLPLGSASIKLSSPTPPCFPSLPVHFGPFPNRPCRAPTLFHQGTCAAKVSDASECQAAAATLGYTYSGILPAHSRTPEKERVREREREWHVGDAPTLHHQASV